MGASHFSGPVYSMGVPLPIAGFPALGGTYRIVDPTPASADLYETSYRTIGDALSVALAGDVILVAPGSYDESVTVDKAVTIIGCGPRGSVFIEPSALGVEGMLVTVDDVTLVNLGVAGGSDADYALQVGSQTLSPDRFRAHGCKFEGPDGAVVVLKGAGDALFEDCEFCWGGSGVLFDDNDNGYCTQIRIRGCWFHNLVTVGVGVATSGLVKNLELRDCTFDDGDEGVAPTDYILLSSNDNFGIITGNRFATATNATGVLTIGTGLMWVANATEAGWSTARPS